MTKEDLVLEGAHAVMRITKREVDWNTAVRISRCIMAMQDVSVVKDSLTVPDGWQLVPIEPTEEMLEGTDSYLINPDGEPVDIVRVTKSQYRELLAAAPVYSGSQKRLQDMSKAELIDLIESERDKHQRELEAIGAGEW